VVARAFPEITADDSLTFSVEAGGRDLLALGGDEPMTVSGNYRMVLTYYFSLVIGAFIPYRNSDQGFIIVADDAISSSSACIFSLFHSYFHKNPILGVIS
jgi:hypothetical protein